MIKKDTLKKIIGVAVSAVVFGLGMLLEYLTKGAAAAIFALLKTLGIIWAASDNVNFHPYRKERKRPEPLFL